MTPFGRLCSGVIFNMFSRDFTIAEKMEFVKEVDLKSVALDNLQFLLSKMLMVTFQGQF